jgi:PhzF family phenazine biosynthesis protein
MSDNSMTHAHPFHQVDVFSAEPLRGNPLAVVHAAGDLDAARMAQFARWTNLSETSFLLPPTDPGADYRVRIFTPDRELPFAGHPTLGSCAAWLAAGGQPRRADLIVQECGVGRVRIRRQGDRLAFAAPPLQRTGGVDDATLSRIATALRVRPEAFIASQWLVNGPRWVAVMLRTHQELLALQPDFAAMGDLELGVIAPVGGELAFEVRAFVPTLGVNEDPVTGSLQAGLAQPRYVAAQGSALGRAGRVHVERDGSDIWIGGDVAICVSGQVRL